jgi:hypothetical protein
MSPEIERDIIPHYPLKMQRIARAAHAIGEDSDYETATGVLLGVICTMPPSVCDRLGEIMETAADLLETPIEIRTEDKDAS